MNKWQKLDENYLQFGLKIFPIKENGKTPLIARWQEECSNDYMQVLYWYENAKKCNWAMPATPNNLFVLDLDVHDKNKNGVDNFNKLLNDLNFTDEEIDNFSWLEQSTPSGGRHIIFESDDELKNVSNASNIFVDYQGIDCRSDGYIVIEPSEINGKKYMFNTIPSKPSKMPKKLKKYILENANIKTEKKKTPYEKPKEVFKGDRDNSLFEYINNLYFKTRLDYDEILLLANNFNENIFDEPLPKRDVKYKVNKAFDKNRGECMFIRLGGDLDE